VERLGSNDDWIHDQKERRKKSRKTGALWEDLACSMMAGQWRKILDIG
jgi:hypothetical protein